MSENLCQWFSGSETVSEALVTVTLRSKSVVSKQGSVSPPENV